MIRDYIKGGHENYLAPLTALIIFYAFFALISAIVKPVWQRNQERSIGESLVNFEVTLREAVESVNDTDEVRTDEETYVINRTTSLIMSTVTFIKNGWVYLNLDRFPDEVDTQHESSLAALEATLRNQGIPLFLGPFFLLWLSMAITLRKWKLRMSAYAAASAYILCQFSFFMLFTLLLTFGKNAEIGLLLILLLLAVDYHQWLGIRFKKSLWLSVKTAIESSTLQSLSL